MSWLLVDDGFAEHPKVMDVSDRAFRLHVSALCFCARNLTDGELADRSVRMVCALSAATKKHVTELVAAGLWVKRPDGSFEVKDYLDYNPTAEVVKRRRADAAERQKRHRVRNALRNGTPDPDPSKTHLPTEDQDQTFQPPEQTRASVAALVDESLGSGFPDAAPVLIDPPPTLLRRNIGVLIELLPSHEVERNTRSVLERKFAQLPAHFVDLAREELLAAGDDVRSRVRYLNGIADRMIRDLESRRAVA